MYNIYIRVYIHVPVVVMVLILIVCFCLPGRTYLCTDHVYMYSVSVIVVRCMHACDQVFPTSGKDYSHIA